MKCIELVEEMLRENAYEGFGFLEATAKESLGSHHLRNRYNF
ncbi:MAG: hypothetical protein QXP36_07360 [Conexivisphaerales archaeon]